MQMSSKSPPQSFILIVESNPLKRLEIQFHYICGSKRVDDSW